MSQLDSPTAPPPVYVRAARADDLERMLVITEIVAGEGRWIGRELPLDRDIATRRFLEGVSGDDHLSLVAAEPDGEGERMIGHLHLGVAPYGVAELGMHIVPERRGQGVGRALMQAGIEWAQARPDVHKITLQVWPHNVAAIGLYTAFGFEHEGVLHHHYRRRNGDLWDAIVMGLLLTDTCD